MSRFHAAFLAASLALSLPALGAEPAPAPKPSAKVEDIRRLLALNGAAKLGQQMLEQITANLRQVAPKLAADFSTEPHREAKAEELVDQLVGIYDKHFTHQEVKDFIAFCETPSARKLGASLPPVTQESAAAG